MERQSENEFRPASVAETPTGLTAPRAICGFWRRIIALGIDQLLLVAFGHALGLFFFAPFSHLGAWGRLVGFTVGALYFGPLNSTFGGGKTIGKRLANIKVVGQDGMPISLSRSVLRYSLLFTPLFLNGIEIPVTSRLTFVFFVTLLTGTSVATIYLYCCNRRTRQSLHDLVAGSYVVDDDSQGAVPVSAIWRGHLILAAISSIVVAIAFTAPVFTIPTYAQALALNRALQQLENVQTATVRFGNDVGKDPAAKIIVVDVVLQERPENFDKIAAAIATTISKNYVDADSASVDVRLRYGYSIGFGNKWYGFRRQFSIKR